MHWTRYQRWVVYSLRVTSREYENQALPMFWRWVCPPRGERQRVSMHWMHWTSYRMKPVSFERASSMEDENHNVRNFCWWIPFFCQLQSRRKRARVYSAGNSCQGAAEASGVWQWCSAGSVTPSNAGLLIALNYLIGKVLIITMYLTSAYCYKSKFFFSWWMTCKIIC